MTKIGVLYFEKSIRFTPGASSLNTYWHASDPEYWDTISIQWVLAFFWYANPIQYKASAIVESGTSLAITRFKSSIP